MATVVIDDHLLRDVLTGTRPPDLDGIATSLATTGLWLFRLSSAWAAPGVVGKLTATVAACTRSVHSRCMGKVRTNIEIEDTYLQAIMDRYHLRTKTEAVDLARRHLAGQPTPAG